MQRSSVGFIYEFIFGKCTVGRLMKKTTFRGPFLLSCSNEKCLIIDFIIDVVGKGKGAFPVYPEESWQTPKDGNNRRVKHIDLMVVLCDTGALSLETSRAGKLSDFTCRFPHTDSCVDRRSDEMWEPGKPGSFGLILPGPSVQYCSLLGMQVLMTLGPTLNHKGGKGWNSTFSFYGWFWGKWVLTLCSS